MNPLSAKSFAACRRNGAVHAKPGFLVKRLSVGAVRIWLCGTALLLLSAAPDTFADTTYGSIEGTVTDPSGAVVPGVSVRIRHLATASTAATTTNAQGLFWFPAVPVGIYDLVAEKSGFALLTQKEVTVTVGSRINLTLALPLPTNEQSTTVIAEPPLLETTRSQVSSTIDGRTLAGLPL